jgi:uncharacterized protein YoaH (UPF0181 family)
MCEHKQVISIGAKHSDMFWCTFPDGTEYEGYGCIPGISSGDYIDMNLCVDCGSAIGLDLEKIREVVNRKMESGRARRMVAHLLTLTNDLSEEDYDYVEDLDNIKGRNEEYESIEIKQLYNICLKNGIDTF